MHLSSASPSMWIRTPTTHSSTQEVYRKPLPEPVCTPVRDPAGHGDTVTHTASTHLDR